jgi:hypothetical protein
VYSSIFYYTAELKIQGGPHGKASQVDVIAVTINYLFALQFHSREIPAVRNYNCVYSSIFYYTAELKIQGGPLGKGPECIVKSRAKTGNSAHFQIYASFALLLLECDSSCHAAIVNVEIRVFLYIQPEGDQFQHLPLPNYRNVYRGICPQGLVFVDQSIHGLITEIGPPHCPSPTIIEVTKSIGKRYTHLNRFPVFRGTR